MTDHISEISFERPTVDINRGGWGRDFQAEVLGSRVTGRVFYEPGGRYHTGPHPVKVMFDREDDVSVVPAVMQDCETSDEVLGLVVDDEAVAGLARDAIQQHFAA